MLTSNTIALKLERTRIARQRVELRAIASNYHSPRGHNSRGPVDQQLGSTIKRSERNSSRLGSIGFVSYTFYLSVVLSLSVLSSRTTLSVFYTLVPIANNQAYHVGLETAAFQLSDVFAFSRLLSDFPG